MVIESTGQQVLQREKATWVCCDSCGKWRQVSQSLADSLDENTRWYCKENPNAAYSSCEAPQELSDDEIDRAVATGASVADDSPQQLKALRPAVWQHVKENIFTHRPRKIENEDDIMVCQCRPPSDGGPGCGENCLNRMLNQECNPEFCPCGSLCSNTQFTTRQYADIDQRRAGPKGFGLFTKQALKAGQFVIEYVGEVLEEEEYLRRKLFYQDIAQRHYYFMNVGNGEVIDACRKGGLGRFINHSCDPNCETQKWVVHGELAIGLFVLKDVHADEELTFDYNFERYGDKALRCYCKSKNCRGYIGGTPEEHEVDKDSEENMDASNDPEPIMVVEEDAFSNPACQAILANEVGLATADFQDDTLRKGWEELAAKYGLALDWEVISKALPAPADSAQESKAVNGAGTLSAAAFEAVEQKLRESKVQRRFQPSKAILGAPARKRSFKDGNQLFFSNEAAQSLAATPSARQTKPMPQTLKGFRRRSEVDRRLDSLVAGSGKLRDAGLGSVVRMLRLFNLCDIGSANPLDADTVKAESLDAVSRSAGGGILSGVEAHSAGTALSDSAGRNGDGRERFSEHRRKRARLDREDGEASPRSRSPSRLSADPEREDGEIGDAPEERERHSANGNSKSEKHHGEALQLTARQRARMADVSLLLDVILKTSSTSTKKEFCNCGILRQLQSVLSRCTSQAFAVIVKKILRAIKHLPLTAEDFHQHSSAHGSFSDTLWTLGGHDDYEIRNTARKLRDQFPLEECSKEVQEAARTARNAAAARRARRATAPFPTKRRWESPYSGGGGGSSERYSRPSSGRPRPASRFHGPNETPVREASGGKEAWGRWPRERESLWSYGPAATPAQEETPKRGLPQAAPMIPSSSTAANNAGWHGLHRLHNSTGAMDSHPSGSGRRHDSIQQMSPPRNLHSGFTATTILPGAPPLFDSTGSLYGARDAASPRKRFRPDHSFDPSELPGPPPVGSPVTPNASPPPPLPSEPPPSVDPPGASPVTPDAPLHHSPMSPADQTGAYFAEPAESDEDAPLPPDDVPGSVRRNGGMNDWKVPSWSVQNGVSGRGSNVNIALAAPLSLNRQVGAFESGSAAPLPPDSEGAPSIDGDVGSPSPSDGAAAWDRPDSSFEEFVDKVISHRLGKYKQPDHPNQISREDFKELFKKSRKAIIEAERKAFQERERNGASKQIERHKLETRIKDYVRELIRRLHERKAGRP